MEKDFLTKKFEKVLSGTGKGIFPAENTGCFTAFLPDLRWSWGKKKVPPEPYCCQRARGFRRRKNKNIKGFYGSRGPSDQKGLLSRPVDEDLVDHGIGAVGQQKVDDIGDILRHYHPFAGQIRPGDLHHIGIDPAG